MLKNVKIDLQTALSLAKISSISKFCSPFKALTNTKEFKS